MLPDSGSILRGVHFREVPIALMLSPGWSRGDAVAQLVAPHALQRLLCGIWFRVKGLKCRV